MAAVARVVNLVKNYHMEEVVVPALAGVTLDFEEGGFRRPHGAVRLRANRRCSTCSAASTGRPAATTSSATKTCPQMDDDQLSGGPQPLPRLHLSVVQPAAAVHGRREHRDSAALPGLPAQRTDPGALHRPGGDGRPGRPARSSADAAFRRPAAARRHRPRPGQRSARDPRRRADRQPRLADQRRDHAAAPQLNDAGKTIIMVTHENDIAAWARRVVRMRDGHIESDVRNDTSPVRAIDQRW